MYNENSHMKKHKDIKQPFVHRVQKLLFKKM